MADSIRMDSHKLIYHPATVARWLNGENIYPIELEISPSGACNHRCTFCAVDYLGYKPYFLNKDIILRDINFLSKNGLKSVICSGEGEPLLNKDIVDIVHGIKSFGVDVALSSNAVLFSKELAEEFLEDFTWIRFSIASFDSDAFYKIQGAKPGDLERVKNNLANIVEVKRKKGIRTTLGVQCLLMEENAGYLEDMAIELCKIGVDYLTIKPYSQHLYSNNRQNVDYEKLSSLENRLKRYDSDSFKIIFRANAMQKLHREKDYKQCLGLPFMTHIDSKGDVWPCIAHISNDDAKEFSYGNINENTFEEIWNEERRKKVNERLLSMDINKVCREACRLDEINKYLNELKNPGEHVNFI